MPTVCLFTRDLRVHDQPVLHAAAEQGDGQVVPLFVVDDAIEGYRVPNRARFLAESLADLDAGLRDAGAGLVVRWGEVAAQVAAVADAVDATAVHVAGDVSAYAGRRRRALEEALGERELVVHDAVVTVVSPGTVTPASGDHFKVFTPYHRRWAGLETREPLDPPKDLRLPAGVSAGDVPAPADLADGPTAPDLLPGGERAARAARRLARPDRRVRPGPGPPGARRHLPPVAVPPLRVPLTDRGRAAGRHGVGGRGAVRAPARLARLPPPDPRRRPPRRDAGLPRPGATAGAATTTSSRRGRTGAPGCRSSTPACASCTTRAGCTTVCG